MLCIRYHFLGDKIHLSTWRVLWQNIPAEGFTWPESELEKHMNAYSNERNCELYDEPNDDTDIARQYRYMKLEYYSDVS